MLKQEIINYDLKIRDYHLEKDKSNWDILTDGEKKKKVAVTKKILLMYKDFPKATNPHIKKSDQIMFYIGHVLGTLIPIINIWRFKKFFNLIFYKVKINPVRTTETKRIKNYKRDRRFRSGYRDESIYWKQSKVKPDSNIPYWNLTERELEWNKKWAKRIGVGYLLLNGGMAIAAPETIPSILMFAIIGLVISLSDRKRNDLGIDFSQTFNEYDESDLV